MQKNFLFLIIDFAKQRREKIEEIDSCNSDRFNDISTKIN